jgi:LPS-assembly lipoprotein
VTRALVPLLLLLGACGFHLRGAADLPFETLYLPNATSGIALELKRHLQSGSDTRVVDDPKAAQAMLQFTEESRSKEILALNTAGRVREYRLVYRVSFRVADGKGAEFVPPSTITLGRDITYDDTVALAKETEEQLLFRDMQADMVQQILRRLTAARDAPKAD